MIISINKMSLDKKWTTYQTHLVKTKFNKFRFFVKHTNIHSFTYFDDICKKKSKTEKKH